MIDFIWFTYEWSFSLFLARPWAKILFSVSIVHLGTSLLFRQWLMNEWLSWMSEHQELGHVLGEKVGMFCVDGKNICDLEITTLADRTINSIYCSE